MPHTIDCPSCQVRLRVSPRSLRSDRRLKCTRCGSAFTLASSPGPENPPPERDAPRARPGKARRPRPQRLKARRRANRLRAWSVLLIGALGVLVGLGLAGGVWVWLARTSPPEKDPVAEARPPAPLTAEGQPAPVPSRKPSSATPAPRQQPPQRKEPATQVPPPQPARPAPPRPKEGKTPAEVLADARVWKADRSPEKWRRRVLTYTPYDGVGRYTMGQRDGVAEIQGLEALARRFGEKPYPDLQLPGGRWRSERVIFRDVDTGAKIVRLTNDPWTDELSYFGQNWSADGKQVLFRRRPGKFEPSTDTHGPMAVTSDGTEMRNVFRDYKIVRNETCSPTDPHACFAIADTKQLVAFDLRTGKTRQVLHAINGSWFLKVSSDGQYLLGRTRIANGDLGFWVVRQDGQGYREIPEPKAIHDSYRFHPTQNRIMYWYEGHFNDGFVLRDLDGGNLTKVPVAFDWNHGDLGPDRGVHTMGQITRIQGEKWLPKEVLFHQPGVEYYDHPYKYNGYVTWMPKDQHWVYSTRIVLPPFLSEIHSFHAEPVPGDVVNRFRICYTDVIKPGCLDNVGASPDGTKVLFNSNMLGRVDAYYVIARLPEAPRDLQAKRSASSPTGPVELTWSPAAHHAETAGYHVYRSTESGVHYEPITTQPVREPRFVDRSAPGGKPAFYKVSAVEHSGLESPLSEEVAVGVGPEVTRRLFVEAEHGQRNQWMWQAHLGLASNLHYMWMRGKTGEGVVTLPVDLAGAKGPWVVWGRVRGEKGVEFKMEAGGSRATMQAPRTEDWTWVKFKGTLAVNEPSSSPIPLRLTSSLYGSAIDRLLLTSAADDQAGFSPAEAAEVRWPKQEPLRNVQARARSPYAVKVAWPRATAELVHHYNVYCGEDMDFPVDQSTLVASPDENECLDWGLEPGKTYHYRVTWVDRGGNESLPSPAVEVTTPKVGRVVLTPGPADKISVSIPREGVYVLWLKLAMGKGPGQYLNLDLDGKRYATWTITFDGIAEEAWFSYGEWGRMPLKAGPHEITLENNTKHKVQEVLLTNDLSHRPKGHVNTLRGW